MDLIKSDEKAPQSTLVWSVRSRLPALFLSFGVVVAFLVIQYARYGPDRFLGWDTPYYVYQAKLLDQFGLVETVRAWSYPHLYVLVLWALGKGLGGAALVERFLPLVWLFVLLAVYQVLSLRLTGSRTSANLGVVFAGISINTIVMFDGLNRQLMALSLSLLILALLSVPESSFFRLTRKNVALHVLLLAVAATQLETFVVLSLTIIIFALLTRKPRIVAEALASGFLPLLILAPLLVPLASEYQAAVAISEPAPGLDPATFMLYVAGSAITFPLAILGGWRIFRDLGKGNRTHDLVGAWLLSLLATFAVLELRIVNLPALRVLYLMPLPILLILGLPMAESILERARRWRVR